MVDPDHTGLSVSEQCRILGLHRSTYYYERQARRNEADLEDLKLILAVLGEKAFYGYRKVARELRDGHPHLTRKRVEVDPFVYTGLAVN